MRLRLVSLEHEYQTAQEAATTRYEAACARVDIAEKTLQDLRSSLSESQAEGRRLSAEVGALHTTNLEVSRRLEERDRQLANAQADYRRLQEELNQLQAQVARIHADRGTKFF